MTTQLYITPSEHRPGWDSYFMEMAVMVASRATCLRRSVGAVIVSPEKAVLSTGYNGSPRGTKHCAERGGCLRQQMGLASGFRHELCYGSHAEQNAVAQAAMTGVSLRGATCYATLMPCNACLKSLINAGVARVVYMGSYDDEIVKNLTAESGIIWEQYRDTE